MMRAENQWPLTVNLLDRAPVWPKKFDKLVCCWWWWAWLPVVWLWTRPPPTSALKEGNVFAGWFFAKGSLGLLPTTSVEVDETSSMDDEPDIGGMGAATTGLGFLQYISLLESPMGCQNHCPSHNSSIFRYGNLCKPNLRSNFQSYPSYTQWFI